MGNITACLAKNIRQLRKQRRLTQNQLAKKAGISLVFLQGIESQRKWLSPQTIEALAAALEVPQARLFVSHTLTAAKIRRLKRASLDHIPDDVFNALATTCKHPSWKWETLRWIVEGFSKSQAL